MNTTKTTPKDFFFHLSATVVLYASVIALINLAVSVINYFFPDKMAGYFYANSIAWPVSMLVVLVPLLYVLEYFILLDIRRFPEKADLWIRRWRIYLTLFLTGAVIVGDLITFINVYLNGEISIRFVYKVLAVVVIAGLVFAYYLLSKISPELNQKIVKTRIILAWVGIVIVLGTIVAGLLVVGSPSKQRNLKFDDQRLGDLSNIQWQIVSYWQNKSILPRSLYDLDDPISGFEVPVDPETEEDYGYRVLSSSVDNTGKEELSFELCANFALPTPDNENRGGYASGYYSPTMSYDIYGNRGGDNWDHDAGSVCFTRTIDKDKYPINKK